MATIPDLEQQIRLLRRGSGNDGGMPGPAGPPGSPGPPGPPGSGSIYVDVTDSTWAGGALGNFDWRQEDADNFNGLTNTANRANLTRNNAAFKAAWDYARTQKLCLYIPPGAYALAPGILATDTNDAGIIGQNPSKTQLWHIGVTNAGDEDDGSNHGAPTNLQSNALIAQRMVDGTTYWTQTTLDSGGIGQPQLPPIDGFTVIGAFARHTSGGVSQGSRAATGLWCGGGNKGFYNIEVQQYHGHTGTSEVDGINGDAGTGETIVGDIAVLFQNEPHARGDGGNAYSEETTFGPRMTIRDSYNGLVVDGQMNSTSSFKGTVFQGLFVAGNKNDVQIINSAWLYDSKMWMRGNVGGTAGCTVFRIGAGDDGDGKGTRFTGHIDAQFETNDPDGSECVVFEMDNHAWWFSNGRVIVWTAAGGTSTNSFNRQWRQFHHDGPFVTSDKPHIDGWHIHDHGLGQQLVTAVDDNTAYVFGRYGAIFKKGTKLRWDDDITGTAPAWASGVDYDAGDKVTVSGTKYLCLNDHTSTTGGAHDTPPGNTDDWTSSAPRYAKVNNWTYALHGGTMATQFSVAGDAFVDPKPHSLRYSHETPPDYGVGATGDGAGFGAIIGGVDNDVDGITTISGQANPILTPLVGPVLQLAFDDRGDTDIVNDTLLGTYGFGGHDVGLKGPATYINGRATAGWTNSSQPASLEFWGTRSGSTETEEMGTWSLQGIEVEQRYSLASPAAGQQGTPLLVTVEEVANNSDSGIGDDTGQTSTDAPYSLGYPRARVDVGGRAHEKINHALYGQPPAFQHDIWYSNYPLAVTINDIGTLTDGQNVTVDSTRGWPDANDPAGDRIVYLTGGVDSFTYDDTNDTQFLNITRSSAFGIPAGTLLKGKADGGDSAIAGQGFLNVPMLGVTSETSFPIDGSFGTGGGPFAPSGTNFPGALYNTWAVGFYDLPGWLPQVRHDAAFTFTQNLNQSGTLDNIQSAGFTSMVSNNAGTRIRKRWGLYVEDIGGATGGGVGGHWALALVVPGGFPADVRVAFDDSGSHNMTLAGDVSGIPTTGGNLTIETTETTSSSSTQHIAMLNYASRSGQILSDVVCWAGHGFIQVGARVGFGALADEQIGVLIGRVQSGTGDTEVHPLSTAATNTGIKMAVGGDGPEKQYGIQIRQVGTVDTATPKLGIYNEAPFRQIGPTDFWGDITFNAFGAPHSVDFTNATVTGITVDMGFVTGQGGTVTQLTNKSTAVTLDKVCGKIVMNNESVANGGSRSFRLNNNTISADDLIILNITGGVSGGTNPTTAYLCSVSEVGSGYCRFHIRNVSGASRADSVELHFAVIDGVIS